MSREELDFIAGNELQVDTLAKIMAAGVRLIVITDCGNPLRYFSAENSGVMTPMKVTMVDATAAGDAFVGPMPYSGQALLSRYPTGWI